MKDSDTPLRVIVVDDEPLARAALTHLLVERGDVTIVATCANGVEALAAIRETSPDVVFLDVRMPEMDGIEVVQRLDSSSTAQIVFVTAFDKFAIEAFQLHALDYLLKPVQAGRLADSVARAREQRRLRDTDRRATALRALVHDTTGDAASTDGGAITEFLVRTGLREIVVRAADVDWFEADTYYVRLHVGTRSHLVRERMHVLASRLDQREFLRVHRSAIVNLRRVRELVHGPSGSRAIILSTGATVRATDAGWMELRRRLGRQAAAPAS